MHSRFPVSLKRQMDEVGVSDVANLLQKLSSAQPTTLVGFHRIYEAHLYQALRRLSDKQKAEKEKKTDDAASAVSDTTER